MNHGANDAAQLLHELRVHQIELELQNEELRRAQLALELSRARYFDLYDLAPVGYLTVSAKGLILEANLCAATLLGVARSELVQRPLSRFIAKAQQDQYYQCRQQLLATGLAQTCELPLLQSGGTELWTKLNISTVGDDAEEAVLRVILHDISDRKRLDAALQDTNAKLEAARLQADKANLAKSEFLSSMSHELRSPLNAILGFAQLMDAGSPPPTPSQRGSLAQILKGGWYLLDLVNEILDLAQIESGNLALCMESVPLAAIFADCQNLMEPIASASSVSISFTPLTQAWAIWADPTRLKQVMINLLSNAIKYNRLGGKVVIDCQALVPQRLRISVRDTGHGLAPTKLAQLFQPFNRLGQEASATKGTGIGLVVSQRLIQSMDGAMGVASTVGLGSEFWYELNLVDQAAAYAVPTLPALSTRADLPGALPASSALRWVLYVEDNPDNMALIEQLLARRTGINMLGAQDAMRGVAMARSYAPELIVMDINLPGINGLEALKILRADPVTAHIPVLALSANAMPGDLTKGLAAGFYAYLTKPIKVNEFMAALDLGLALAAVAANVALLKIDSNPA